MSMLLEGGLLLGRFGTIRKCMAVRDVSGGLAALLWLGSPGGLLGSTPRKNEVSGRFCLPVRSDLRLLPDLRDDFVAMQSGTNCLDSGLLHWDWLCGLLGPTPSENEVSE